MMIRAAAVAAMLAVANPVGAFSQVRDSTASRDSTAFRDLSASRDSTVVLRFAGDLLLAEHYAAAAGKNAALAFEEFDLLRTDDVSMVNQECPITIRGTPAQKPFTFRMDPSYVPALREAGIEIVALANNHTSDYGDEGLFDTFSYLDSAGIRYAGAGRNIAEARHPVIVDVKGRRIGFLAYYGGGEARMAGASTPGVAPRQLDIVAEDIRSLREKDSADVVIVTLHFGVELATEPESEYTWFARRTIAAGADAVIGHHPHVLQGIERYRKGVIAYSLGNFIFGGNSRDTYRTAVFEIRVTPRGMEYELIPVGVERWRARVLTGHARQSVIDTVRARSALFPRSIFRKDQE